LGVSHLDTKSNDFSGGKELSHFALEKVFHKPLKGNTFGIKINLVDSQLLQVFYDAINNLWIKSDVFLKDFTVFLLGFEVDRVYSFKYFISRFVCANLEFVRLASLS